MTNRHQQWILNDNTQNLIHCVQYLPRNRNLCFLRNDHVGLKNTWGIKVVFWRALSAYIFLFWVFLTIFFHFNFRKWTILFPFFERSARSSSRGLNYEDIEKRKICGSFEEIKKLNKETLFKYTDYIVTYRWHLYYTL